MWTASRSWLTHGPHSQTVTDLQVRTDAELAELAALWLDLRAMPRSAPTQVMFTVSDAMPWADATADALLGLDVMSALEVHLTTRPPARLWQLVVTGISWSVTPDTWTVTCDVAPGSVDGTGRYDDAAATYDELTVYDVGLRPAGRALVAV